MPRHGSGSHGLSLYRRKEGRKEGRRGKVQSGFRLQVGWRHAATLVHEAESRWFWDLQSESAFYGNGPEHEAAVQGEV